MEVHHHPDLHHNTLNLLADFRVNFPLQNPAPWWGKDTTSTMLSGPLLFSGDRGFAEQVVQRTGPVFKNYEGPEKLVVGPER